MKTYPESEVWHMRTTYGKRPACGKESRRITKWHDNVTCELCRETLEWKRLEKNKLLKKSKQS